MILFERWVFEGWVCVGGGLSDHLLIGDLGFQGLDLGCVVVVIHFAVLFFFTGGSSSHVPFVRCVGSEEVPGGKGVDSPV